MRPRYHRHVSDNITLPTPPPPPNPLRDLEARARDVATTLGRVHSRLVWAQLGTFAAAAATGTIAVVLGPIRDWLLFLAMYLVIAAYLIAYLKAWLGRRRVVAAVSVIFAETLSAFFAYVLADRAPSRRAAFDGVVVDRPDMPLLWVSAALLLLSALLLLTHWVYTGYVRRGESRAAQAEST